MKVKDTPGVLEAARHVVDFASPIQRIVSIDSPTSHTSQSVGYFVPAEKIDDLRESLDALKEVAEDIKKHLGDVL